MPSTTFFKVLLIGLLTFILFVPLLMIWALTGERTGRRATVEKELGAVWGQKQTVSGVALAVPYEQVLAGKEGSVRIEGRLIVLPQTLSADATLAPEVRRRSIFSVNLYQTTMTVSGTMAAPNLQRLGLTTAQVMWDRATVHLGLTDLRGAVSATPMSWGATRVDLEPSVGEGPFGPGLRAPAPLVDTSTTVPFSVQLVVAGSGGLLFVPTGGTTDVLLRSTWPHPGFTGGFLPTSHTIDATGFLARWRLTSLSRPYPQAWIENATSADAARERRNATAFGVDLVTAVDHYQQVERAVKYGFLFIVMTLGLYLVWEVVGGLRIHPIQYLFVGLSLVVFYLLLLSLAEQVPFVAAYAIAASATVMTIAGYSARILTTARAGAVIAGWLGALYGLLFVLLQLEDLALLVGSVAVFLALAALMYFTRGVDWYRPRGGVDSTPYSA